MKISQSGPQRGEQAASRLPDALGLNRCSLAVKDKADIQSAEFLTIRHRDPQGEAPSAWPIKAKLVELRKMGHFPPFSIVKVI